jgi:serine/threonine-protein kinase CHEK1
MSVDPARRFSFAQIRQHPWYTRHNSFITRDGKVADPVAVATQMLECLQINLDDPLPPPSQAQRAAATNGDAMDVDSGSSAFKMSATQPETPINDVMFDFERTTSPSAATGTSGLSSTQPVPGGHGHHQPPNNRTAPDGAGIYYPSMVDEPTMSQFSRNPGASLTMTQKAREFRDIVPAYSLARFFSLVPPALLVQMLIDALHRLNVPIPPTAAALSGKGVQIATLRVRTLDGRGQRLHGEILVDKNITPEGGYEVLEVRFVKVKGDPLEWRRFFKKMALLCKDAIYKDDNYNTDDGTNGEHA